MRVRSAVPLALAATVAIGSFGAADAAPKKKKPPIKKTYTLQLAPDPDASEETACSGSLRGETNMDIQEIKVSGPGLLTVKITDFAGDWDTSVYSKAGSMLTEGGGTTTPETLAAGETSSVETMKYKSKKAQSLFLRVCNFLGSPTATVTYTYVYN